MNKRIIALLLSIPALLVTGCKYEDFGPHSEPSSEISSSEPSSEQPSSSEEVDPYAVDLQTFNKLIRKLEAVTFNANFTANTSLLVTGPNGSTTTTYFVKNDKGKYHLHSNDSDPLEDTYYAYNVNTYNQNEFKCDCTIYSYNSSTQVWEDDYHENDYFFPMFALMGFPYRDFHYDRFTYNKDEHKYTCPIAVMTEGDNQTEIRDITLMFENNVLIYSELTIVVIPGEDPEHPKGTMAYTTNFTDFGTTTVTFPTNN